MENLRGPGSKAQQGLSRRDKRGGRRGGVDCRAIFLGLLLNISIHQADVAFSAGNGQSSSKAFCNKLFMVSPSITWGLFPSRLLHLLHVGIAPLHTLYDYCLLCDASVMSAYSQSSPEFQQLLSKLSAGPAIFSYLQTIYLCGCFPVSLSIAPKYIINEIWKNKPETCVNNYLIFPAIHCLIPFLPP